MRMKLEEGIAARISVPKGENRVTIFDTAQAGFFLRKFANGKAIYGVKYTVNGKQRQKHLREVVSGVKGLAAARKEAADVRAKARLGTDVVAEARAARAAAKRAVSLGKLVETYLSDRKPTWKPRSYVEFARHLRKDWKPLHNMAVGAVGRPDVVKVIDAIAANQGRTAADKAKSALAAFYVWAIDGSHCTSSPMVSIKSRACNVKRERVLSVQELIDIWHASTAVGGDYEKIIKLLMLTGQRRDEIGGLFWAEVAENGDGTRIDLPGERTKNRLPHMVSLSLQALALMPAKPDRNDPLARTRVFGDRPHTGFSGWSKAKRELDGEIAVIRKKRGEREPMPAWHMQQDLRRTFVTMLGDLKIAPPHVVEQIVNHVSGHKAGVAGVYNKALYWEERIEAMKAWGEYIDRIIAPQKSSI